MSVSSLSQSIPTKRMMISDLNQLPSEFSSTPGGTLYGTTPGGSRIIYDRSTLMQLKNSPMSRASPKSGSIPEFLLKGSNVTTPPPTSRSRLSPPRSIHTVDEEQFILEI